jgi:ribosomal-protein-alanine N-acetyltransferase
MANNDVTPILTQRLILRQWSPDDLVAAIALGQDPAVMRHYPALQTEAATRAMVEGHRAHIDKFGFGSFAVERRDTGALIGICGCKNLDWPHTLPSNIEVGWRFTPSAWGHGFATEAARAALDHCFALTGVEQIFAFTVQANQPSWSVMERLKMLRRPDLDFDHPRVPDDHPLKAHIVYGAQRTDLRS